MPNIKRIKLWILKILESSKLISACPMSYVYCLMSIVLCLLS